MAVRLLVAIAARTPDQSPIRYEPAVWFRQRASARNRSRWSRWTKRLASAGVQLDYLHAPKVGAHSPRWRLHLTARHSPAEIDDLADLICDISRIFTRRDRASCKPLVQAPGLTDAVT